MTAVDTLMLLALWSVWNFGLRDFTLEIMENLRACFLPTDNREVSSGIRR